MMTLAEAELTFPAGEKLNQSMGSLFQGIIMDRTDMDWAEAMHKSGVRPYSQYVTVSDGRPVWRVAALTDAAFEQVAGPIQSGGVFPIRQRGYSIAVGPLQIKKQASFQKLEETYWTSFEKIHHIDLNFLTSTSFKNKGKYAIFPQIDWLFGNLIRKWNAFSDSSVLGEENLEQKLAEAMYITDYRLHTHPFSLEGRRIRAFRGTARLGLFQSDTASRMAALLCDFANFAGIGIKTAMGMGAVETEVSYFQKREAL